MISKRSDEYRYNLAWAGTEITPLAAVEAYVGTKTLRVQNISIGGIALVFDEAPSFQAGDVLDISVSIRERAFPIQIEVKNLRDRRMNCEFVSVPPAFQNILQEFLQPKFLGGNLQRSLALSERPGAVELVPGATRYDAYLGQNQTGFFVWTDAFRHCLKLVGVSRELVFEWSRAEGLKTGRLSGKSDDDIQWDRAAESQLLHYFADILLAWFRSNDGTHFVERLISGETELEDFRFPDV